MTQAPAKKGTTYVPTKDGGKMASNDTKTTKDEAARILESFLLHTWGAVSTSSGVLVAGEAGWVTQAAVWVRSVLYTKCTVGGCKLSMVNKV